MKNLPHIRQLSFDDLLEEYHLTRSEMLRDEVVVRIIPLAKSIARGMALTMGFIHNQIDDYIDWAMEGAWKAALKFDKAKLRTKRKSLSASFMTYAQYTIRFTVISNFRDSLGIVKTSREMAIVYDSYLESYFKQYGNYPNDEEIETFLSKQKLMLEANHDNIRDSVVWNTLRTPIGEFVRARHTDCDDLIEAKSLFRRIFEENKYLLDEEDREILRCLFVEEMKISEVAAKMHLDRLHVLRAKQRLLLRLRGALFREWQELKEAWV